MKKRILSMILVLILAFSLSAVTVSAADLATINAATDAATMKTAVEAAIAASVLDGTTYNGYSDISKTEVIDNMVELKTTAGGSFADDAALQTAWTSALVLETVSITIDAKDYAIVFMRNTKLSSTHANSNNWPDFLGVYINTLKTGNGLQFVNPIATFVVPCRSAIYSMTYNQADTSAAQFSSGNGYGYVAAKFEDFPFDYPTGMYLDGETDYMNGDAVYEVAKNYITSFRNATNGKTNTTANANNTLSAIKDAGYTNLFRLTSGTAGKSPMPLNKTAMADFLSGDNRYMTLYTGIKQNHYIKYRISSNMTKITVNYAKGDLLSGLANATPEQLVTYIDEFSEAEVVNKYYNKLDDDKKLAVATAVSEDETSFSSFDAFKAGVESASVESIDALNDSYLASINTAADAAEMQTAIEKLIADEVIDNTTYAPLTARLKVVVAANLLAARTADFETLDAVNTALTASFVYDDFIVEKLNEVTDVSALKTELETLIYEKVIDGTAYNALSDRLKTEYLENMLTLKGEGFAEKTAVDTALVSALEFRKITADLSATDTAFVVMSTTQVYDGRATPPSMTAYINETAPGNHAHYSSRIATYKKPGNLDLIDSIEFNQYDSIAQQMQNGYIYFFGTFSGFPFDYEDGTYTQGTEGEDEAYTAMNSYVSQYWTANATTGEFNLAGSIAKSNANASKPVVLTDDFVAALDAADTDYFTLHNGKLTSPYMYYNLTQNAPAITITYTEGKLLDALTACTDAASVKKIVEGLITNTVLDNTVYETLSPVSKMAVATALFNNIDSVCESWDGFKEAYATAVDVAASATPVITIDSSVNAGAYSAVIDDVEFASENSVVLYGTATGTPDVYGFMFAQYKDEIEAGKVQLVPMGMTDEGKFAIRVIGEGITAGTYKAWPFMTVGGATTENTADVETITVAEAAAE